MKTDETQKQNHIDLEPFYQALEDDPKLLEEALEILLGMVNFELSKSNQDKGNTPSCCGGH